MINLSVEEKYNRVKLFFLGVLDENSDLMDIDVNRVEGIKIGLASPDEILNWSHINCKQSSRYGECNCTKTGEEQENCTFGEILKPETINYRTMKPEKDGLFCEKIFGPSRDYECFCGKYKRMRYKGLVCDRCGVEVIQRKVRRLRMGHIKLAAPVAHIWFYRGTPSLISILLDCKKSDLESVILYQDYIVVRSDVPEVKIGTIMEESDMVWHSDKYPGQLQFGMGAEALDVIFTNMNLAQLSEQIMEEVTRTGDAQRVKKLRKRLMVINSFIVSGNRPEWMCLKILPVIPPDLRPLVPLDGGRFAASDLNDLYRKIINRNNRLKKLEKINAPEIIQRNEKRMLQEAVDALLDNSKKRRPTRATNNRPLKSLSDSLRGKQGRFRQNLLGKRVDYSGRSVIVVGPNLELNQCGLPKRMAIQLFEPFIIRKLKQKGYVQSIRLAKKMLEREDQLIYDILEEVVKGHPVMLNRAPTLHRISFQAFFPTLTDDLAVQLHPLSCAAFNADFDGDQMAVHLPLTPEAILECRQLMLAENNILSPANGRPVASPSQDMVLGAYYMTYMRDGLKGEGKLFSSPKDVIYAYDMKVVDLQAKVRVRYGRGKIVETSPGRVIFNNALPDDISIFDKPFAKKPLTKKLLSELIYRVHKFCGAKVAAKTLDAVKNLGFYYSTRGGISVGINDMVIPGKKPAAIEVAQLQVKKIRKRFANGVITDVERYNQIIDIWTDVTERVAEAMMEDMRTDRDGLNPIYIMAQSGARGSEQQIRQLAAMRGLMQKPLKKLTGGVGEIIETPIVSNFREGLSVIEYFISTHGARKGLADTALKTADAGYLTRRLIDVAQDLIVKELDCGTEDGIFVEPIVEEDRHGIKIIEDIDQRIQGRFAAENIYSPTNPDEMLVAKDDLITEEIARKVKEAGIERVKIRSVLTCQTTFGLCAKCYGMDLTTHTIVKLGTPVGIIAAQSIGEPGTQLTLRTFHIGGTASTVSGGVYVAKQPGVVKISKELKEHMVEIRPELEAFVQLHSKAPAEKCKKWVYTGTEPKNVKLYNNDKVVQEFPLRSGMVVFAAPDQQVEAGDILVSWDTMYEYEFHPREGGLIRFEDIIPGENLDIVQKRISVSDPKNFGSLEFAISKTNNVYHRYLSKVLMITLINKFQSKSLTNLYITVRDNPKDKKEVIRVVEKDETGGFKTLYKMKEYLLSNRILKDFIKILEKEDVVSLVDELLAAIEAKKPETFVSQPKKMYRCLTLKKELEAARDFFEINNKIDIAKVHNIFVQDWAARIGELLEVDLRKMEYHIKDLNTKLKGKPKKRYREETISMILHRAEALDKNLRFFKSLKIEIEDVAMAVKNIPSILATVNSFMGKVNGLLEIKGLDELRTQITDVLIPANKETKKAIREIFRALKQVKSSAKSWVMEEAFPMRGKPFDPKIIVSDKKGSTFVYRLQDNYVLEGYFKDIQLEEEYSKFLTPNVAYEIPVPLYKLHRRKLVVKDITGGLPRVQEIFEARQPKEPANLAPCDAVIREISTDEKHNTIVLLQPMNGNAEDDQDNVEVKVPEQRQLFVKEGERVKLGMPITNGQIRPLDLLELKGKIETQKFLLDEVQEVYRLQGVNINDKHLECIICQMFKKYTVVDPGESQFVTGQKINELTYKNVNEILRDQGKRLAIGKPELLGITKTSLETDSFLSAASFQETTRVLSEAAIRGKVDLLMGLKENIIIGHVIPAGTGFAPYRNANVKMSIAHLFGEEKKQTLDDLFKTPEPVEEVVVPEPAKLVFEPEEIQVSDLSEFDNE